MNADLDRALRPTSFADFTGQGKIIDRLKLAVLAARQRGEPVEHIVFHGPPGLGKTTLAHVIAHEMGSKAITIAAPTLQTCEDAQALLLKIRHKDVLFLDELHRLKRDVEEYLYSALEDFEADVILPVSSGHKGVRVKLAPFTVIGATTQFGKLTAPMRMRFGIDLELDFYSTADLTAIVIRSAGKLGVALESDAAQVIAARSRGTPRIANRLLRRARDLAQVGGSPAISPAIARTALETEGVDEQGMNDLDRSYVRVLRDVFNGGPAGPQAIAASLDRDADTLVETVEPYLLRIGVLARTPRGRKLVPQTAQAKADKWL